MKDQEPGRRRYIRIDNLVFEETVGKGVSKDGQPIDIVHLSSGDPEALRERFRQIQEENDDVRISRTDVDGLDNVPRASQMFAIPPKRKTYKKHR